MDAKIEHLIGQIKARIDELAPGGSREKSLAMTNLEQAQLWAEAARRVAHPAKVFHAYAESAPKGWLGWILWGNEVEAFIALDGEIVQAARIDFAQGVPVSYLDADGHRRAYPGGPLVDAAAPAG